MRSFVPASLVLYARIDAADTALAHPTRAGLLARVLQRPGITLGELARDALVDPKTMAYHARTLSRLGLLSLVPDGRRVRAFAAGASRAPLAPPPRAVRALHALAANDVAGPAMLARLLGTPRGTAGSLLEALARAGLAERDGAWWRPTARALEVLPPDVPLT
jgi:DNA-binding IclR family transcriptional regulator